MARFYLLVGPEPGSGPHCYHGQQGLAHARGDPRSTRFEHGMVDTLTSCEAQLMESCEICKDIVRRDWELLNQLLS